MIICQNTDIFLYKYYIFEIDDKGLDQTRNPKHKNQFINLPEDGIIASSRNVV
jgi:hypothetical protein